MRHKKKKARPQTINPKKLLYYEKKFKKRGWDLIIGVDEVGRGPLAGPVVASAAALKTTRFRNRIDDSKKLTADQREKAFKELVVKSVFGLGIIDEKIIDRVNILEATRMAMEKAVEALIKKIEYPHRLRIHLLIDGNVKPNIDLPFTNIIKGDSKSKSIAAASRIPSGILRGLPMSVLLRGHRPSNPSAR